MCGIAGFIARGNAAARADRAALERMTEVLRHRGPDDSGVWFRQFPDGAAVGLGSRRLSIIDLSPAGHMPMSNEDGTVWITHNGEVYNFGDLRRELVQRGHTLRSRTDTEVLLHLYEDEGPECVRRLNGMFAFAICDLRSGRPELMLARDHFGIKPLYYLDDAERMAFASEVKGLLELPGVRADVDLKALHQYMTFLWVPDPATLFRGIRKLPAGHYALVRDGAMRLVRYWDVSFPPADGSRRVDERALAAEIRDRFTVAVRAQKVSDVPIGAFLSAGIDSSSIVAVMARATQEPVRTYTITFPRRYRVGENTLDDPAVPASLARSLGCDHHEIMVEPQVVDLLPHLVWHMDEPTADPALITAYLVAREARRTVTVLLSGLGGDEVFAGYRKYAAVVWATAYRRLPQSLRRSLIEPVVDGLPPLRGTPFKGALRLAKKMIRSASLPPHDAFMMNSTYLDDVQKASLYAPELLPALSGLDPWAQHRDHFRAVAHADFLHQMQYVDIKSFLVSLNLTYNDKMSMASSVEVRVPFLDRDLVEFVAQHVPPRLHLGGRILPRTKSLFRLAMRGVVPEEVLWRPKASFGAPVDYWLSHDLREMVDDLLSEGAVRRRGYFRPAAVRRLVDEHRQGRADWSMQIWQLLTLELWLQVFADRPHEAVVAV